MHNLNLKIQVHASNNILRTLNKLNALKLHPISKQIAHI